MFHYSVCIGMVGVNQILSLLPVSLVTKRDRSSAYESTQVLRAENPVLTSLLS